MKVKWKGSESSPSAVHVRDVVGVLPSHPSLCHRRQPSPLALLCVADHKRLPFQSYIPLHSPNLILVAVDSICPQFRIWGDVVGFNVQTHHFQDPPEDAVVTMCGHVFCYQCVSDYLNGDDNTCPTRGCKAALAEDVVFSKATLRSCLSDELGGSNSIKAHDFDHSLVQQNEYSWTSMLDLVEASLQQFCMKYRRLDGRMSLIARDRSVKDFNTDPEVTVMLMSLKVGNLGLNMVAACHVILLDLWWNPTTEDQAIDRAHRIG
ncbi:helicase-like transcription factor CHR27 [Arachis stenosperma]|uniref:helicase-like transcription factor CHR27 n=1 Tax=Arachis stenosperma TaxID=217475 RepID=UPI0025ABCDB2|nr:helicase-like transcription factor CHR27 [Arachis stenosperma]XP_057718888.1 helicase-like transcription factor CHR27 [Arachis stenosperma]XP_057718889.1 helicase-like transcription factor CHR27 [Arachis stenosperma]XP_057718890.1 helicase-like transcription factor CHR27 [Arachis stenosperma]XP_057718891.1 helicase-like transcription factor CHR27 [Arachis stenosperma]XP_057718892.1 helicase-like transcription factor CHR27 [Arachis stenosperma]